MFLNPKITRVLCLRTYTTTILHLLLSKLIFPIQPCQKLGRVFYQSFSFFDFSQGFACLVLMLQSSLVVWFLF